MASLTSEAAKLAVPWILCSLPSALYAHKVSAPYVRPNSALNVFSAAANLSFTSPFATQSLDTSSSFKMLRSVTTFVAASTMSETSSHLETSTGLLDAGILISEVPYITAPSYSGPIPSSGISKSDRNTLIVPVCIPCRAAIMGSGFIAAFIISCLLYVMMDLDSRFLMACSAPWPTMHRIIPLEARRRPERPIKFISPIAFRTLCSVLSDNRASRMIVSISTSLDVEAGAPTRVGADPAMK